MNTRILAIALGALAVLAVAAVYAFSAATNSGAPDGPRPIAGMNRRSRQRGPRRQS